MALPTLDLEAMERIERKQTDRRLAVYLCETMSKVLPRLPTEAPCVAGFVEEAGLNATHQGFDQGRQYSTHIMISFLLGLNWQSDPVYDVVPLILDDRGLAEDVRLNMALNTAIKLRQQLEVVQPKMHAITLETLLIPLDDLSLRDMWSAFQRLAELRGVVDAQAVLHLLTLYEADACTHLGLPAIKRKILTAYERLGYQHMGLPLPLPTDELKGLERDSLILLTQHVLLALSLGRFQHMNPLFQPLHQSLGDTTSLSARTTVLVAFLRQHQKALTEEAAHA